MGCMTLICRLLPALSLTLATATMAHTPEPPRLVRTAGAARPVDRAGPVPVEIDRGVLAVLAPHEAVRVEIDATTAVTALITESRVGPEATWWTGPLVDDGGWLAIARSGDVVYANLQRRDGRMLSLRPAADGAGWTVAEVAPDALGCATGSAAGIMLEPSLPRDLATAAGLGHFCGDGPAVIEVMVVYTTAAREGQGGAHGMQALIALSEATTNLALAASAVPARVRVVLTLETKYTETGNATVELHRLADTDDDAMDEVHLLRDQVGADLVALIVHEMGTACGQAFFAIGTGNQPFPHLGFSVTKAECAVDNLVFAHELGHNFGCRHNREFDDDPGAFEFSHGHALGGDLGTVMAVSSTGVTRVPHYSNPEVLYDGVPTGVKIEDPESAYSAESIRRTAFNLANFRCSDCNRNGAPDLDDIAFGVSADCDGNGVPDECDIAVGLLEDCDGDGRGDSCSLADGTAFDCNFNGRLDRCDIAAGAADADANGVPDQCEDCNGNGIPDGVDIAAGASVDCDGDGRPDECEDCNGNTLPDGLEIGTGLAADCDANGLPDECDIAAGELEDADGDGMADACEAVRNETAGTHHLTIQLAIDAASDGDVIAVDPGVYVEALDLRGKAIHLVSTAGAADTVLLGDGLDEPLVTCASGEGPDTIVEGFTLTGSTVGAWRNADSSPLVVRCIFADNTAVASGGAMRSVQGSPTLVSCELRGNTAQLGGALYAFGGSPRLVSCTLAGNTATVIGDALVALGGGQPLLHGCIIWGNGEPAVLAPGATIRYSDVQGGWRGAGEANVDADPMFVDPASGDLRLAAGSPCVDAGDNGPLPAWATLDVGGAPRIVDDPDAPDTGDANGGDAIVDMGARERQPGAGDGP
jgi:hypothetical protein